MLRNARFGLFLRALEINRNLACVAQLPRHADRAVPRSAAAGNRRDGSLNFIISAFRDGDEPKDGKLVALAKILHSAITGKIEDGGVQGDLEVKS